MRMTSETDGLMTSSTSAARPTMRSISFPKWPALFSLLIIHCVASGSSIYPVTLDVCYGLASSTFNLGTAGQQLLSPEVLRNPRCLAFSAPNESQHIATRKNFALKYSLAKSKPADTFVLQSSMNIETAEGDKSLTNRAELKPGAWLFLGGTASIAPGRDIDSGDQFVVIARATGTRP